ncbi:MAG: Sec-independent protein translocase protein TatB [Polyangiaceae bacterium]
MFGLSFPELLVVIIAAIVVIGPKDLPKVLRKAGQWAGRLRRMAADLRAQSGIDEVLREGNLHHDINEIRKLARGEIHDVMSQIRVERTAEIVDAPAEAPSIEIVREREHPVDGPDGLSAMPESSIVYVETDVRSPWATDDDYVAGLPFPESPEEDGPDSEPPPPSPEVAPS